MRDGVSTTILVGEVLQGQGKDLRGFSWWGDASEFTAYLAPNSGSPDRIYTSSYCNNQPAQNLPCANPQAPIRRCSPRGATMWAACTSRWATAPAGSSRKTSTLTPGAASARPKATKLSDSFNSNRKSPQTRPDGSSVGTGSFLTAFQSGVAAASFPAHRRNQPSRAGCTGLLVRQTSLSQAAKGRHSRPYVTRHVADYSWGFREA